MITIWVRKIMIKTTKIAFIAGTIAYPKTSFKLSANYPTVFPTSNTLVLRLPTALDPDVKAVVIGVI